MILIVSMRDKRVIWSDLCNPKGFSVNVLFVIFVEGGIVYIVRLFWGLRGLLFFSNEWMPLCFVFFTVCHRRNKEGTTGGIS